MPFFAVCSSREDAGTVIEPFPRHRLGALGQLFVLRLGLPENGRQFVVPVPFRILYVGFAGLRTIQGVVQYADQIIGFVLCWHGDASFLLNCS
jgi:hypothetical protein